MNIKTVNEKIQPQKKQLLNHTLYEKIKSIDDLRQFQELHIYAVWDFMSLLKALQTSLTCTTTPWLPTGNPETRYLINEIVLGEESDVDEHDHRISHFELYLKAMRQMGAPTNLIDALINEINNGHSIEQAIQLAPLPNKVKMFLLYTFEIAQNAPLHVKAAVFTFGREDLIPDMFTAILNKIYKEHPDQVATFKYYIERHIEVDGGHHSQLALEMVTELCGNDAAKWEQATSASLKALEMRSQLWDAINENKAQ